MSIIQEKGSDVKDVLNGTDGTFVPGGKDRATVKTDLSVPPAPSGRDVPSVTSGQALVSFLHNIRTISGQGLPNPNPDGAYAVNFRGEAEGEGTESPSFPLGLSTTVNNCDNRTRSGFADVISQFRLHKYKLSHTPPQYLHLQNKSDESEALYRVDPKDGSRYFSEGRKKLIRRLCRRLDGTMSKGILMTCTVDTKLFIPEQAWKSIWRHFKRLMDALNKYRQRNMSAKGSLMRIAVLEQTKKGYPHLHVFFPGLDYLIDDLSKLDGWWGMGGNGSVDVEASKGKESARGYVLKYIHKMSGWSEDCMAILWKHHIRLYNLSHCYYLVKRAGKWILNAVYNSIEEIVDGLGFSLEDVCGLVDTGEKFVYIRSP